MCYGGGLYRAQYPGELLTSPPKKRRRTKGSPKHDQYSFWTIFYHLWSRAKHFFYYNYVDRYTFSTDD